jgi:hypothetical protein
VTLASTSSCELKLDTGDNDIASYYEYHSNLAASAQIALFLETLKMFRNYFSQRTFFVKEKRRIF